MKPKVALARTWRHQYQIGVVRETVLCSVTGGFYSGRGRAFMMSLLKLTCNEHLMDCD